MANIKVRKTHTIALRLDELTYNALEKTATRERRTISDLVRIWITDRLAKDTRSFKKVCNG